MKKITCLVGGVVAMALCAITATAMTGPHRRSDPYDIAVLDASVAPTLDPGVLTDVDAFGLPDPGVSPDAFVDPQTSPALAQGSCSGCHAAPRRTRHPGRVARRAARSGHRRRPRPRAHRSSLEPSADRACAVGTSEAGCERSRPAFFVRGSGV